MLGTAISGIMKLLNFCTQRCKWLELVQAQYLLEMQLGWKMLENDFTVVGQILTGKISSLINLVQDYENLPKRLQIICKKGLPPKQA